MNPEPNDTDLTEQLRVLESRKRKLTRIIRLRKQVDTLERQAFVGTEARERVNAIAEEVCAQFKIDFQMLMSPRRPAEIATPRQVVFYLSRELTDASLETIGQMFHKDHGTVLHGQRQIISRMKHERDLNTKIQTARAFCEQRFKASDNRPEAGV